MSEQLMDKNNRRFNPDLDAELWRKKQQEKVEHKPMDPEKLAEEVSDRLIKIHEEEMEHQLQSVKTGKA